MEVELIVRTKVVEFAVGTSEEVEGDDGEARRREWEARRAV